MFPLSDIICHSYFGYLPYVWKKTSFLIQSNKKEQLLNFWKHLCRGYDYKKFWSQLDESEKNVFLNLLSSFCYVSSENQNALLEDIEKKSSWILKYPLGGIFIPAELIKNLMREKILQKKNFLFSLLFRLKLKEQKNLTGLIESNCKLSEIITDEKNSVDMALVLYIYFANFHTTRLKYNALSKKPSVLNIESGIANASWYEPSKIDKPLPMWNYLYSKFSDLKPALDEWYYLLKHTKNGFYRSLSLVTKFKRELLYLFCYGYFIPILPKKSNLIDKIKIVTPSEILCLLNSDRSGYNSAKKFVP